MIIKDMDISFLFPFTFPSACLLLRSIIVLLSVVKIFFFRETAVKRYSHQVAARNTARNIE